MRPHLIHAGMPYAELQAVSNFSFLEGGSHPDELVAQAKALGLSALGLADRNTVAGVVRAHTAAKDVGLRLLVGARLDLEDAPQIVCYPTDRPAWGRLCRLLSLGQSRAPKGQCHLRLEDVARHVEGQIVIVLPPGTWDWRTASVRGGAADIVRLPAGRTHQQGTADLPAPAGFEAHLHRMGAALTHATSLNLAASHTYRGDDRARIAALAALAHRTGLSLVATGSVLYHVHHRRPLQDVLSCIRAGVTLDEAGLRLASNAERHLKAPAEMARLFAGYEAAVARTQAIADACRFSLDELVYEYPSEPVPPGTTAQAHLEALARDGIRQRFPNGVPEQVSAILERELAIIRQLDYAPYFLTVNDIVAFARSRAILAQGRGSAANSVVCYALGITAVNPTEVDLLFERFVSPERREPPDIDVDFEHERREEVIQHIYARYGRDRAGLAATVISYRSRSAVREVGKVMGLSDDIVAALAGMVWGTRSGGVLPEAHVREAGLDPGDPLLARTLELAGELTGFPRHLSQHVGGFVLTRGPLIEVVPVGNAAMADRTFIEWDKDDLAALGLLKVDVLALGMLTCIRKAFDLIAVHEGRQLALATVPREDPAVYDMLCKADSIGVFQVESRAQMNMLPRLRPRCFYDLVIEVAIVRPGPIQGDMVHPYLRRRSGRETVSYPAPAPEHGPPDELRRILGKTLGVPLFQEQAMRIAMDAARLTDAEVNELRKAMATFRRRGTIGQLEAKMVEAMVGRGYSRDFAERCFNQIKGFGEYGFPESHAASFAHLVYVSSWLKRHHPAAFAAALLNSQPMGFYAPAQIVRDASEHGVEVREADINHSDWDATLEICSTGLSVSHQQPAAPGRPLVAHQQPAGPALRLGLRQIEGMSEAEARRIVEARHRVDHPTSCLRGERAPACSPSKGPSDRRPSLGANVARSSSDMEDEPPQHLIPTRMPFTDVHDLRQRTGLGLAALGRLAAADTMRSIGLDRRQGLWEVKGLQGTEPLPLFAWSAAREAGQEEPVALPAMPLSEHVVSDYQTLRLSLKAHPVSFLRNELAARRVRACADLKSIRHGAWVAVAGVVLVRQRPGSAKGVVFMTIEDETGIANVVVWSKTLERFRREIMTARLMLVRGRIQRHEGIVHIVSGVIEDRSDLLATLMEDAEMPMPVPIANADEVLRPDPGSARSPAHPRWPGARHAGHPREARIIPRSRDFH
ncbi:MAG: error-prone DNA polymerase [Hyphomicrobiaceae bacterium]|nr:error-prone DNA polymerase [Hyphomicrobiaceae bacterium]